MFCVRRFIALEYLADTAVAVATIHGLAWINEGRRVIKSLSRNEESCPLGCVAMYFRRDIPVLRKNVR